MARKHIALGTLFTLSVSLVACGGGGSSLSEDDFLDELDDICADINGDIEDVDAPDEGDFGSLEDFADEAGDILEDGVARLEELSPPNDLENDFADLIDAAQEQLTAARELAEAAADEDEDALNEILEDAESASDDFDEAADDLGAEECLSESVTTDTTEPSEITSETAPATTEETVSPSVEPVLTLPTNSEPPLTMPPATNAPVGSVSELDIVSFFAPPAGYTFEHVTDDISGLIEGVATDPALGPVTSQLGAVDVIDPSGVYVARLWILFTSPDYDLLADEDAALAWLDWVGENEVSYIEYTTAGGIGGYLSDFDDGSQAYATIDGSIGVGAFGDAGFDVDSLIDGFFDAN